MKKYVMVQHLASGKRMEQQLERPQAPQSPIVCDAFAFFKS